MNSFRRPISLFFHFICLQFEGQCLVSTSTNKHFNFPKVKANHISSDIYGFRFLFPWQKPWCRFTYICELNLFFFLNFFLIYNFLFLQLISFMWSSNTMKIMQTFFQTILQGLIALLAAVDALSHLNGLHLSKQVITAWNLFRWSTYIKIFWWIRSYVPFFFLILHEMHNMYVHNFFPCPLEIFRHFSVLQLVFVVFTGEAWGFLGSRRFLLELDQHSDAVSGLDFTLIETVLPIHLVNHL